MRACAPQPRGSHVAPPPEESALRSLRAVALDRLSRRRDVWLARSADERAALQRLRYRIYAQEQGDTGGRIDARTARFIVPGDEHDHVLQIGCGPRDAPVATVRVRSWAPGRTPPAYARQHAIHRFPGVEGMRVAHVGHLMVDPGMRGTRATLGFVIAAMELAGRTARPDILFAHAAPGLLHRHRQLGLRPFGAAPFGSTRGLEVPLALVPEPDWLRRSGCLWGPSIRRLLAGGSVRAAPTRLLTPFSAPGICADPAALRLAWRSGPRHALRGLGPAATQAVLQSALMLDVPPGVTLMVEGFGESDPQLLLRGSVRVEADGHLPRHEGAGALLGAEDWRRDRRARAATVRTMTACTVLNFRARSLRRLPPGIRAELGAAFQDAERRSASASGPHARRAAS